MYLHDEEKLHIFGEGDSIIKFTGSLEDEFPSFYGRFRITAGGARIYYEWNSVREGWSAVVESVSEDSTVRMVDATDESSPEKIVPIVAIDKMVDVVRIESLSIGGKIRRVDYLVNKKTFFKIEQLEMIEKLTAETRSIGVDLPESFIKGFVYFNLK